MTLTLTRIHFFVPGTPKPQGSKRHIGNGRMIESSAELKPWRERIALLAHNTMVENHIHIAEGHALSMTAVFVMPRPASTPKSRTPDAVKRPDLDKLIRAVADALTGIIFTDDAAITHITAHKRLAEPTETPGVHVSVGTMP